MSNVFLYAALGAKAFQYEAVKTPGFGVPGVPAGLVSTTQNSHLPLLNLLTIQITQLQLLTTQVSLRKLVVLTTTQ